MLLAWGAANRIPRQHEDLRPRPQPIGHLRSFGIHPVSGDQLARMEWSGDFARKIVANTHRVEVVEPPDVDDNANSFRRLDRVTSPLPPRRTMKLPTVVSTFPVARSKGRTAGSAATSLAWMCGGSRKSLPHHSRWHFSRSSIRFSRWSIPCLGLWQKIVFLQAYETVIADPPIVKIMYWHLLHELLVVDDRHRSHWHECLAPHHFLLTEWFAPYVEFGIEASGNGQWI